MTYVHTRTDLQRIVSTWVEGYDMSCYELDYDDFLHSIVSDMLPLLRSKGFVWGSELPEITEEELQQITEQYAKEAK